MQVLGDDPVDVAGEWLCEVCGMWRQQVDIDAELVQVPPQPRVDTACVTVENEENTQPWDLKLPA